MFCTIDEIPMGTRQRINRLSICVLYLLRQNIVTSYMLSSKQILFSTWERSSNQILFFTWESIAFTEIVEIHALDSCTFSAFLQFWGNSKIFKRILGYLKNHWHGGKDGQFLFYFILFFFLPKIWKNNWLGGQSSILSALTQTTHFPLEILSYRTICMPSSVNTQCRNSWAGVLWCVNIVQRT